MFLSVMLKHSGREHRELVWRGATRKRNMNRRNMNRQMTKTKVRCERKLKRYHVWKRWGVEVNRLVVGIRFGRAECERE